MPGNKKTKMKVDRRERLMEKCRAYMALMLKRGDGLGSSVATYRNLAMEKVFPKRIAEFVK